MEVENGDFTDVMFISRFQLYLHFHEHGRKNAYFLNDDVIDVMLIHFQLFRCLRADRVKRSENDKWISLDGKHSVRCVYKTLNVYVWTGS